MPYKKMFPNMWLTMNEFTNLITIAEMTPGPIAVNSATFVGIRIAGPIGAVIATFGCILPSCFICSVLAYIYFKYKKVGWLQSILGSLRPVVVALIAAAGLSILNLVALNGNALQLSNIQWKGIGIFLVAFFILRKWKWNPILVMCLCGAAGLCFGMLFGNC